VKLFNYGLKQISLKFAVVLKMKINERTLATLSSGLLAGMGSTLTLIAVPAIKASNDPLPSWKMLYKTGSKFAISNIIITTAAGIQCFLKTEDVRYALMSGLSFAIIPYTLLFMKPTNDSLFAIDDNLSRTNKEDESRVRKLIAKWDKLQYGRTILGLSAFFVNVMILYKKIN
jgi:hypothetical protein